MDRDKDTNAMDQSNAQPEESIQTPATADEPDPVALSDSVSVVPQASDPPFPIVGIGASAGGLAAFEAFFSGMPAEQDPNMAFVLVQHLAPNHKSMLTDLVKHYTRMQVLEVEDGMHVQPNCTYIIPPNCDMAFLDGTLQLMEPSAPHGLRLPIDFFFRSLAQDQRERAICIVLSGSGSDGATGLRAIKAEGGLVMAQHPESASFDGMPRSAIATGLVDFVLPPAEMPAQLIAYASHAFARVARPIAETTPKLEDCLPKICLLLRDQTGHDFSQYKQNTVMRRVERRMAINQIELPEDYARYLRATFSEAQALFRDLLIGVTNFFRDTEPFQTLETEIIPKLFADKPAGAAVRVWVCGCATGEEAYSIAILLQEHLDSLQRRYRVQVFATDIDPQAISQARAGVFPASIAADISRERLARFFSQEPDSDIYRIHRVIRDLVIFSEQDVIRDPSFSKLDLISCRNLLIYLNANLQAQLIPLFHRALNPGGFLFLGTSETTGNFGTLFTALDRKNRLYQRQPDQAGANQWAPHGSTRALASVTHKAKDADLRTLDTSPSSLRQVTEHTLLAEHAEAGALIDSRGEILYIHGRTGQYLEPASGGAAMNILSMAREGLVRPLTLALHQAVAQHTSVDRPGLSVRTNGSFSTVNLALRPALGPDGSPQPGLFLVILKEVADSVSPPDSVPVEGGADLDTVAPTEAVKEIAALKQELRDKDEYLLAIHEEMQSSNEELKSINEEMQSVNEELQSTNEELETSKEELQSVNEELATVNAELQAKVTDLSRVNDDMNNLLSGTGIATLFVDHQLRIMRFTPTTTDLVNLINTDVGRPISHISPNTLGYDRLSEDVQAVLRDLAPREREVQTKTGAWYLLRIRPYRTLANIIEGAVITFTDITARKKIAELLEERERELKAILQGMFNAFALFESVFSADEQFVSCRFLHVNNAFEQMMGVTDDQVRGKTIHDVWPGTEARWIEAFAQVATSGIPSHFEMFHAPTSQRFCCNVLRPGESHERFCVILEKLTSPSPQGQVLPLTDTGTLGPEKRSP